MELKTELTINGIAVELDHTAFGLEFYCAKFDRSNGSDVELLYVVKGNKVIGEIEIEADCDQNMGYVSEVKMKEYE